MTNLFGKSELEKLRDLDYKTESHTFSKGVIAAYYNGMEYPMIVNKDYVSVKRRRDTVFFLHEAERYQKIYTNLFDIHRQPPKTLFEVDLEKDTIYSPIKTSFTKKKTKEVVYDLDQIFTNPSKQVRRGINLLNREEVQLVYVSTLNENISKLYEDWSKHKMNDPKVFHISFTPKRYLRSFTLNWHTIQKMEYYVDGELYGALAYDVQGDIAFELAFISRFWQKKINDLNELILINSFYQLWKQGIKRVNVGLTAGIKGLKVFKDKLPHSFVEIYSN